MTKKLQIMPLNNRRMLT